MFKIIKTSSGESLGMTEAPTYIKKADNGCYNLCPEPSEAPGIVYGGVVYHLLGRPELDGAEDTVALEETDAGVELAEAKDATARSAKMAGQMQVAAKLYVQASTSITDAQALEMPDLFLTWAEVLAAGTQLSKDTIINDGNQLYRVVQPVMPQEHQAPHDEGMLAIYRPIDTAHAGTKEDPIPFVYGMDTEQGKYYSSGGKTYLCNLTMTPCVWPPETPGLWQWSEVTE